MINAGNHGMATFETFFYCLVTGNLQDAGEREFRICIYKCQDKIHGGTILTASGLLSGPSNAFQNKLN